MAAPSLAGVLRAQREEILADWAHAVAPIAAARGLSTPELRDHVPRILERLAQAARDDGLDEPDEEVIADHALERLAEGFDLAEVVTELVLLREAVLRAWLRTTGAAEISAARVVDGMVDAAIAASVRVFTRARDRGQAALDRISAAGLESRGVDDLLERLLGVIVQTSDAVDSAAILLREGDRLRVHAAVGLDAGEESVRGFELAFGEGFAGRIAAERRPVAVRDAASDPLVRSPVFRARGVRALYGVPLVAGGELLGVAHIGSLTTHEFSAADRRLFLAMAERATAGIRLHLAREAAERAQRAAEADARERARLEVALEARVRQLATLSELGVRALRVGLRPLLDAAVAAVAGTLGAELVMLAELVPGGAALKAIAGVGWSEGVIGSATLDAGKSSQAGYTLLSREPVIVDDYPRDPRFRAAKVILAHGAVSGVSAVVETGEGPFGTLAAFARHPGAFSPEDAAFVQSVANVLAAAVERDRAEARLRDDEARLRELYGEAMRALRLRDDVLGMVSHDLRSPVNGIALAAALLDRRLLAGGSVQACRRHVEAIQRAAGRMERLIHQLLDMARVRAGKLAVARAEEDAAALLDEALAAEQLAADEKRVALRREGAEGGCTAALDRDRILQVLANLVGNALKFTPAGGTVVASVTALPEAVRFTVSDTGPGIAPEHLPHVFEAYWSRGESATSSGAGLGLFISRGIVEAHDGRIGVESRPGHGCTFWFELPRRSAPPPHPS